ncbi:MAG: FAD-dependent oxidoreductase [Myxococcota bacterium]
MRRRDFVVDSMALMAAGSWVACAKDRPRRWPDRTLVRYLRTNWSRDPYAFGSYSYVAAGQRPDDRANLERPVDGRVFFAGEALNPNYHSSVHAAHESGLRAVAAVRETGASRVAVVGAGMSGLTAAHGLAKAGVEVTVVEARDRIGGRLWSDDSLGATVDLGASWIHGPDGNPLTALADQLGLKRVPTGDDYVIRGGGGRKLGTLDTPAWLYEVIEATTSGVETKEISEQYLTETFPEYGVGYPGTDVIFPDGYSEILDALRGDYRVVLSAIVERVRHAAGGVTLDLVGGATVASDAVIVTVPLGVLQRGSIAFDPPLDEAKSGAIERMGMGLLDKLYLHFDVPFWDAEVSTFFTPDNGLPQGQFNYWVNLYPSLGVPILLGFNGGSPARALAHEPDETLLACALQSLDRAYPAAGGAS